MERIVINEKDANTQLSTSEYASFYAIAQGVGFKIGDKCCYFEFANEVRFILLPQSPIVPELILLYMCRAMIRWAKSKME